MTDRIWERFLTETDRAHLEVAGPPPTYGLGSRPALLSVDNYRGALGDEPLPLLESIKTWPGSTGLSGWAAIERVEELLGAVRDLDIPVVHITGLSEAESGMRGWRTPRGGQDEAVADRERRQFEIVEQAAPVPGEVIIKKNAPSSFFGTPLISHLHGLGVDTIIVCGESTSGCIRATVIDGRSYRFRVIVAEDAVHDRHEATHAMNLFDMNQKYADVMTTAEIIAALKV